MEVLDLLVKNIEEIKVDIKEIKRDISNLYAFKWRVIGMASAIAFLSSFAGHWIVKQMDSLLARSNSEKTVSVYGNEMVHLQKSGG